MEKLFDIQRIIFEQFEQETFYDRNIFKEINLDNFITGIVGARGIGKTTFLLRHAIHSGAKKRKALYVSADNLYFLKNGLLDLVDQLYKETDVRLLCIDEIHKYPNWNQELKNIADTYPKFRILFSGSSTIDLIHRKYDLSRRVTLFYLHGLSFREYLECKLKQKLPTISLDEIFKSHLGLVDEIGVKQILKHFQEYLRVGYYPFFFQLSQDRDKFQAIENSIQKTIYEDIGTLHSLKTPTLSLIEKLYKYVLSSAPGELSVYKLSSTLEKDFESISTYLNYLKQAGLIRFLFPKKSGKAAMRNPAKMYPENTNLLYAAYLSTSHDTVTGRLRETFVINHLQNIESNVFYTDVGDFRVDDIILEVGGRSKTTKQIKGEKNGFILADGIVSGSKRKIPLYLLGFLY